MEEPRVKIILLLLPYLFTSLFRLDLGVLVSLILAVELLVIRLWALAKEKPVFELEAHFQPYIQLGVLLSLVLGNSNIYHYLGLLLGFLASYLVAKKYRFFLYLLIQTIVFRAIRLDVSRAMGIFISFYYGIMMIFLALGLMERKGK